MARQTRRPTVSAGVTVVALVGLAAALAAAPGARAPRFVRAAVRQPPALDVVLGRAADYVDRFTEAFSNVVAEEHYTQEVSGAGSVRAGRGGHRRLRSDVVLLKIGGPLEWRPYRDVYEVDDAPVRDRDDRLVALFQRPSATAFEQAARIARESARFNIGLAGRTINTPVLSLLFLQRSVQPRFRFKLGKRDGEGEGIWTVDYREQARPTIIRGLLTADSMDLAASGRFWIDVGTGRVSRAQTEFAVIGLHGLLVTSFRHDDQLDLDVPYEMRETYRLQRTVMDVGSVPREQGAPRASQIVQDTMVTGAATYSNFRRFLVTTDASIAQP